MEIINKTLSSTFESLKNNSANFNTVVEELFSYNFDEYNQVFNIDSIDIPEKTYKRLPVFNNENCVAILMLWGVGNKTAVHDHKNYNGMIKVLKGNLTEIYYNEKDDFIELGGEGVAPEGAIFEEEFGGIHSIVNNETTYSVSLHIYQTPQLNLNGVRIFDVENKKWAVLNEKAASCSWNLPEEAFENIYSV